MFSRVLFRGEGLRAGALATDPALALARCTDARPRCTALGQDPEGPRPPENWEQTRERTREPNGATEGALTWIASVKSGCGKEATFSFLTCSYLFTLVYCLLHHRCSNVTHCIEMFVWRGHHKSSKHVPATQLRMARMIRRAFRQEVEALDLTKNEIGFLGQICDLSPSPASSQFT